MKVKLINNTLKYKKVFEHDGNISIYCNKTDPNSNIREFFKLNLIDFRYGITFLEINGLENGEILLDRTQELINDNEFIANEFEEEVILKTLAVEINFIQYQ